MGAGVRISDFLGARNSFRPIVDDGALLRNKFRAPVCACEWPPINLRRARRRSAPAPNGGRTHYQAYSLDCWMGYVIFPLTPALSLVRGRIVRSLWAMHATEFVKPV